ncbi:MAG TPA: hypothetical protein VLT13_03810 [Bacteroidota bacterium]|nr:hypothetical protein [Bacteroidota bacterium]
MENAPVSTPATQPADVRAIETALKALWERVRLAGELVQHLREERQALLSQVEQLRGDVQHLQEELGRKDQLLKKAQIERIQHQAAGEPIAFPDGEREALTRKVKELLVKIDAYL